MVIVRVVRRISRGVIIDLRLLGCSGKETQAGTQAEAWEGWRFLGKKLEFKKWGMQGDQEVQRDQLQTSVFAKPSNLDLVLTVMRNLEN